MRRRHSWYLPRPNQEERSILSKVSQLTLTCSLLMALGIGHGTAHAAEIIVLPVPATMPNPVLIQGDIEPGDATRFYELTRDLNRAAVTTISRGGSVRDALEIGAEIRLRGFTTLAVEDAICASACALIWIAGTRRYMMPGAVVEVHAAYKNEPSEDGGFSPQVSGEANAEIGSYLTHLGLNIEAIRYFTRAGPRETKPITPELAHALDIDVYIQAGMEVIAPDPEDHPTSRTLAQNAMTLVRLGGYCGADIGVSKKRIESQVEAFIADAHEAVGGEALSNELGRWDQIVEFQIGQRGLVQWCVETADRLISDGHDLGVRSPSFNCSQAGTPNERLICRSPMLWHRDKLLAALYSAGLERWRGTVAYEVLRRSQRNWLQARQSCGADLDCTLQLYERQIRNITKAG